MTAPSQAIIRIHSVVDIITNSSSEIFVQASSHTVNNIKDLINSLFKMTGCPLTADFVFTFELINEAKEERAHEFALELKANASRMQEARVKAESKGYDFDEAGWIEDNIGSLDDYRRHGNVLLKVKVKPSFEESKEGQLAAKVLSDLTGLFDIEEYDNS